jgi:hypothetical protein
MLFRFYVWVNELFTVWYEKGDSLETADFPEPFIIEGEVERGLLLLQQEIAIAAVERFWAKALIYFVLSTYPGLKSGAIVYEF